MSGSAAEVRVRLGARGSKRVPVYVAGSSVEVWADFYSPATGLPIAPPTVTVQVWTPSGALVTPAPTITPAETGTWYLALPVPTAGLWRVEFSCALPSPAVGFVDFQVTVAEPATALESSTPTDLDLAVASALSSATTAANEATYARQVLGERISVLAYGAANNGTGNAAVGINAAIVAALAAGRPVEIPPGLYVCTSNILIPANATDLVIHASPLARIERRHNTSGASGFVTNADFTGGVNGTTRPRRITIMGGEWGAQYTTPLDDGSATCTIAGNTFALYVNDLTMVDVNCYGLGPNGRYLSGGGDRWRILNMRGRFGTKATTGSGGIRPVFGDDILVVGADISCADDALQAVPADSGTFTGLGFGVIRYIGCRGRSFKARGAVAALSDQVGTSATMTSSILVAEWINCTLIGGSRTALVSNVSSSGKLGVVRFVDCTFDDSNNDEGTTPQAILINVNLWPEHGTGKAADRIEIIGGRVTGAQRDGLFAFGNNPAAVGTLHVERLKIDPPRFAGSSHAIVRLGDDIIWRNVDVDVAGSPQDGVLFGTPTDKVGRVTVDGGSVVNVADPGGGLFNYGINFRNCESALVLGRNRITAAGGTPQARAYAVSVDCARVRVESADLRGVTAASKIINAAPDTVLGPDILGGNTDDLAGLVDVAGITGNEIAWNGVDSLIRINGTGTATVRTITPAVNPTTVRTLTIVVAPGTATLTLERAGVGNLRMDYDVTLSQFQSATFVWDPVSLLLRHEGNSTDQRDARAYTDARETVVRSDLRRPLNALNVFTPTGGGYAIQHTGGRVLLIPFTGQSNTGKGGAIGRSLSTLRDVLYPRSLLAFDRRGFGCVDADDTVNTFLASQVTALTGYRDPGTFLYQSTAHLVALLDNLRLRGEAPPAIIGWTAADGGQNLNAFLAPGMTGANAQSAINYPNLIQGVQAAVNICATYGLTVEVPFVVWCQGEGRIASPLTVAGYGAALAGLGDRWDTDMRAITGQTRAVRVGIVQIGLPKLGGSFRPDQASIAAQQRDLAYTRADRFFIAGPLWPGGLTDPDSAAHPSENGRKMVAAQVAEAMRVEMTGARWVAPDISAIRPVPGSPTIVRAFFRRPAEAGALLVDSDFVPETPQFGFAHVTTADPMTAAATAITTAATVGGVDAAVDLTFASAPPTTEVLAYALNQTERADWAAGRGALYAETGQLNPYRDRGDRNQPGGTTAIPVRTRLYVPSSRVPMANLNTRIGTQMEPALEAAIGAGANLRWWLSADALDTTDVSGLVSQWRDRHPANGARLVFEQTSALRRGAPITGLLGTERAVQFNATGIRYAEVLTPTSMAGAWTVAAVVRSTGTAAGYVFGKHTTAGTAAVGSGIYIANNSNGFRTVYLKHGGQFDLVSFFPIPTNEWLLVIGSHDGAGRLRLTVGDDDVAEGVVPLADLNNTSTPMGLGSQSHSANTFPLIADVRDIWMWDADILGGAGARPRRADLIAYARSVYRTLRAS